ncbi:MAG: glycosyltransferase family 2 protein, partial [DPANN group archaeon]|nr:glycosyltransferase family 2 protein [DPANN group archaeon]
MKRKQLLSIIIPAYNEENRIGSTLRAIKEYCNRKRLNYEIIIVDDGSNDRTRTIVEKAKDRHIRLVSYGKNRGKGFAVRFGMGKARGDLLLFSDADLSTPIEELDKFLPLAERFDVLIGSRNLRGSDIRIRQPWYRRIPGKIFSIITRVLLLPGIKDSQCGFKLFTRKAA